jgi:two-component system, cell cycle sensor histidine kinase and response regulator CckA
MIDAAAGSSGKPGRESDRSQARAAGDVSHSGEGPVPEEVYRRVVENIREVIFQTDEFGNWVFLNPAWMALTGFEVKDTLGSFFLDYFPEEDREKNRHIFLQLMERRMDYCRHETRVLTRNGKTRWVEAYLQTILNSSGAVIGASGSLVDITERKLAETAIQKLAAFPQANPNPVLEFARDGALTYWNDAASEMAKVLSKPNLLDILPANAGAIACDCLASGQKRMREQVRIGGRTLSWSFFPVASSRVVHCYGADITEMLNLEAQFRHAQKLESVGQLAAGVAHDFNNILTVIQGYAECLQAETKPDTFAASALKQIVGASQRAASLTRQLLTFSRKQVLQPRVLDLNQVLRGLDNMLLRLGGEHIQVEANYASELPAVEADLGMLEQVVMNLVVNSRDAMTEGGKLTIATEAVQIDQAYVARHADARVGECVRLTVSDTGCGMSQKTLERIFEPFFSTKEVGKGTGLGLATVYGIVKQHQGWIEVSSRLQEGTTFRIYFPAIANPAAVPAASIAPETPAHGRKETILVVEDEPVVRELVCEVLRRYEYSVVEAGSGGEALRVWDELDGRIDLLLTDMVMPEGMTGRDLAIALRKRCPELKVIFTSGYSPETLDRDFGQPGTAFLAKPYLPPKLAQIVRQCLDMPVTGSTGGKSSGPAKAS